MCGCVRVSADVHRGQRHGMMPLELELTELRAAWCVLETERGSSVRCLVFTIEPSLQPLHKPPSKPVFV